MALDLEAIETQAQRALDLATAMGFKGEPAAQATLLLVAEVKAMRAEIARMVGASPDAVMEADRAYRARLDEMTAERDAALARVDALKGDLSSALKEIDAARTERDAAIEDRAAEDPLAGTRALFGFDHPLTESDSQRFFAFLKKYLAGEHDTRMDGDGFFDGCLFGFHHDEHHRREATLKVALEAAREQVDRLKTDLATLREVTGGHRG
jgi:hypothetical protein